MEKTMNESLEPNEKGENPKERLGKLKPDLSLIPQSALVLEALAMMQGADKYGAYNWRQTKVQARTYVAATMRHLAAWLDGEEAAPDSGVHHLAHARASLGVVMDAQACGMMADDRVKGAAGRLIEENAIRTSPRQGVGMKIPDGAGGLTSPPTSYPTFYIAGPMRGLPGLNFPAFDQARNLGMELGYTIISPADMDREVGIDGNAALTEEQDDVRVFVQRDVGALLSLSPESRDGIALLPGWECSTGSLAELFVARWLGLRVVSATTFEEFAGGSPADVLADELSRIRFDTGVKA